MAAPSALRFPFPVRLAQLFGRLNCRDMEWPTDILQRFLHFLGLQCDQDSQHAWQQLAFLVTNRSDLFVAAKQMIRPALLRIQIEADEETKKFKIPFVQATVVAVDVDWGDGYISEVRDIRYGYVEHAYAAGGEYCVRIFPTRPVGQPSLDHLGFHFLINPEDTISWWKPLREIVSFGTCGIRSLSYLFLHSEELAEGLANLYTSSIQDFTGMFTYSSFNRPIGGWDVGNVTDMTKMFQGAFKFNQPLDQWDVSNVVSMRGMFVGATSFNQPIGAWNVSRVENMQSLFCNTNFDQPIGAWNVSNVKDMSSMFHTALFNSPIGDWDVGNVTNMSSMFSHARMFNSPIGNWNVSKVTNMTAMFVGAASFDQPIGQWNVGSVIIMRSMFEGASSFNQSLSRWNVSNVVDMDSMFGSSLSFNQPIGNWDVSSVTTMDSMFMRAESFDQPIDQWDVRKVADMSRMFCEASSFNQSLKEWNPENITQADSMFKGALSFNIESSVPPILRNFALSDDAQDF